MHSPHSDKSSSPNLCQNRNTTKLKFGIDRLLSPEPLNTKINEECQLPQVYSYIPKPPPSVMVPCSGCVTSMFRCCSLSPGGHTHHENSTYSGINQNYSVQPIRPFATRPTVRVPLNTTPASPNQQHLTSPSNGKRKRSWSRAVFSNLQRKGLERRFQLQKYITKPDRRQLAATLGLTDAQVKVWFQNRRMKWRHTKESSKSVDNAADSTQDELLIDVDTITDGD